QKGVVRHNPAAGYVGMWGDAVVRVLGPQPGAATTAGDEVNNACLVLLVSRGENDALLTGDAEVAEQAQVMGETLPPVEVYKVPHHGGRSAYYQPFLAKVAPELSVIGVGPNSYGHPSPEVVSALSVYGKVYRTDSDGDVEVQMSDKRLYIQTGSGKSEVLELKPAGGR
ncbi:MAG: hypothetical protein KKB13_21190, partial [Chloroflexi bacterium]|nr:hypothetical protein [Chloroflexota bacterium]